MNIAAVMEALDEWGTDLTAKFALVALCCHADRYTGIANVSVNRLAVDMGCHHATAARAVARLVKAGLVDPVENRPGRASSWQIYPAYLAQDARGTSRILRVRLAQDARGTSRTDRDKGVIDKNQGGDADRRDASAPPEEKPLAPVWVELPDGTVRRA